MRALADNSRRVARATLLGTILVASMTIAGVTALPSRQALSEIPEGIRVEALAAAPELPFRPRDTGAVLLRYTYAPGASFDPPYVGPVLVYVEAGTLSLEAVGNEVEILYPEGATENPLTGQPTSQTQVGEVEPIGGRATLGAGGSVYAPSGDLGPTRNPGTDELILLVVQFVTESRPADVTKVPVGMPP